MNPSIFVSQLRAQTEQILKSVFLGENTGACLWGPPGLGKSTVARRILKENGISYKTIPLHSPPLMTAKFLFENSTGILLHDDVAQSRHPVSLAIQKAIYAPEPDTGLRTIRINSSPSVMKREGIPPEIVIEAKIISVMNATELDEDVHSLAMQSRIPFLHYDFTFEQRLYLLKEASKRHGDFRITETQMTDTIKFIESSSHPGVSNFDLRLLAKAASIVQSSPDEWQIGVGALINADQRFITLKRIFAICDEFNQPVSERIRLFTEATGQSRSTYFNLCKKFGFTNPVHIDEEKISEEFVRKNESANNHVQPYSQVESRSPGDLAITQKFDEDGHGVEVSIEK
jgi:hypothetical protein